MASGMEMALKAMMEKALANLPPEVLQNIGQMGEFVKSVKAQLDRIENQNRLIMSHLNIPDDQATERNGYDDGDRKQLL